MLSCSCGKGVGEDEGGEGRGRANVVYLAAEDISSTFTDCEEVSEFLEF